MIHMLVILIQEPPEDIEIEETTDYTDYTDFFFAFFVSFCGYFLWIIFIVINYWDTEGWKAEGNRLNFFLKHLLK